MVPLTRSAVATRASSGSQATSVVPSAIEAQVRLGVRLKIVAFGVHAVLSVTLSRAVAGQIARPAGRSSEARSPSAVDDQHPDTERSDDLCGTVVLSSRAIELTHRRIHDRPRR